MGHKNTQNVDVSSQIVGSVTQNNYSNCTTCTDGNNSFVLSGNNDVVEGVDQTITFQVNTDCTISDPLNYSFVNRAQNGVLQQLGDQEIALTQWMDNSKDKASADISTNVGLYLTQNNSQTCENSLNGDNTLVVSGNYDVVKNISQTYAADTITTCHMKDGVSFKATDKITNDINQHTIYTSVNPFAFITNAIIAVTESIALLVAFCFIILLCFISLLAILRHRSKSRRRAAAVAKGLPAEQAAAAVH